MTGNASLLRDNADAHRFELPLPGGEVAFAAYRQSKPGVLHIVHVEVPRAVEGRGVGSTVMKVVLEEVRARGQKVVPVCGFAAAYMRRHPEVQDLLA